MTIAPEDYRFLCALVRRHSGLSLGPDKAYLVESRLPPVATALGLADLASLVRMLRLRPDSPAVKAVCDAMTTGETLFFRDQAPFAVFRDTLLPEAAARARVHSRPLRVWSAACSAGQEVYSLAMIADELAHGIADVRVDFLATDFAAAAVARASQGLYSQLEVQRGLPIQRLVKYFTKVGEGFQVRDALRQRVRFMEHNLLAPCAALGTFDVIFLRNVLIYFDVPTKREVLERLTRQLVPGGAVVLGGSENTIGVTDLLVRRPGCAAAVYGRAGEHGGAHVRHGATARSEPLRSSPGAAGR